MRSGRSLRAASPGDRHGPGVAIGWVALALALTVAPAAAVYRSGGSLPAGVIATGVLGTVLALYLGARAGHRWARWLAVGAAMTMAALSAFAEWFNWIGDFQGPAYQKLDAALVAGASGALAATAAYLLGARRVRVVPLALLVVGVVGLPAAVGQWIVADYWAARPPVSSHAPAPPPASAQIFQLGNDAPPRPIVLTDAAPVANRIGDVFPLDWHPEPCPDAADDWSYTHVVDLGLTWVRVALGPRPAEYGPAHTPGPEFNACQEEMVDLLAAEDVTMVMTIREWEDGWPTDPPDYSQEEDVERFVEYAGQVVAHFKDRIDYYEILNEAVIYVQPADYLELVRRTVPVIRQEHPGAKIVVDGASSPFHQRDRDFLFSVVSSDVMELVDAIGLHPFYGMSPAVPATREYYIGYPRLVDDLRATAAQHGFTGQFFSEEMVWRTPRNANPDEFGVYTDIVAAKYYARAIVMHLGMDIWAGIGGESYDTIPPIADTVRNLAWLMDGAEPIAPNATVQRLDAEPAIYRFSLPNGDEMLAIWNNTAAVDDDPGVSDGLIIEGMSAASAVGIDPLLGLEQDLVAESTGEAVVISDLLVRDYPILIRIVSTDDSP